MYNEVIIDVVRKYNRKVYYSDWYCEKYNLIEVCIYIKSIIVVWCCEIYRIHTNLSYLKIARKTWYTYDILKIALIMIKSAKIQKLISKVLMLWDAKELIKDMNCILLYQ